MSTNEPALRLYRALGFATYGREPRALKIGATYYDEDLMVLRLG
jgi:ribosomal protein S18 acetylase RimI-like enzyme